MSKKEFELPPREFGNKMNLLYPDFNFQNWRQSKEWKIYVAGYNACVEEVSGAIKAKYNMGECKEKLFGENHN